jgi:ADP-heptose:LPS heptosyltransferase
LFHDFHNYLYKFRTLTYNKRKMEMHKVLFPELGAIGDLLHTLPALQALRNKSPAAHVTVVVSPGSESLIQGTPVADRVLVFDRAKLKKRLKEFIHFALRLRHERYDLFIDMQPSLRSMMLRWLVRCVPGHCVSQTKGVTGWRTTSPRSGKLFGNTAAAWY